MRQSVLLLLLLSALTAFAQPQFVSPGAEWWYSFSGGFIQAEGWHHIYYEKDTVVAGFDCKKLLDDVYTRYGTNDTLPFEKATYAKFVRQQGDSVFLFSDPVWLLRWRTNPSVGATYTVQQKSWSTDYLVDIKVDSIKPVTINGQSVNKIYQSGKIRVGTFILGGGNVLIYSHIGPEYGTFDYITCWNSFDCFPAYLCRFKNNVIPLYEFNSSNCDVISSTQYPDFAGNLIVSPNPCTDYINFDFQRLTFLNDVNISIVDQSGRVLQTVSPPAGQITSVSTSGLPAGIYYYFISHSKGQFAGRFLKE